MADPVRRPKQEDSAKRSSPGETPGSQDKNTMDSDKTGLSSSTEENSTPESSPSQNNELWNSMSYWYYMQSYYQYYYSISYFYTYYYWQMVSSQQSQTGNQGPPGFAGGNGPFPPQNTANRGSTAPFLRPQIQQPTSCDARVASIQKRVVAELLDFLFLYFTKFLVFSIFYNNMERFTQLQYSLIIDENTSLKELEEILIQALTYRLMVFMYETLFIIGGLFGGLGGATPGKYFMGLSVVSADSVDFLSVNAQGHDIVRAMPGGNPGLWRSGIRALVKNFSMTFLFPIFITVFFFQYNRTIYDILAGTAVVENASRRQLRQHQQ